MNWLSLFSSLIDTLSHFNWRDLIEIGAFSTAMYAIIRLLAQDKQKRLLFWFYGFYASFFISFYFGISGLTITLALSAPAIAMLFIVFHQQTLQKNFITLASLTPLPEHTEKWLPELIQATLQAVNVNKSSFIIIERSQSIGDMVSGGCTLNAPITLETLELLLHATPESYPFILWVNQVGKIKAYKPTIILPYENSWTSEEIQLMDQLVQDGGIISTKSDALAFSLSAHTRFFTLTVDGKLFERLSASSLLSALNRYVTVPTKQTKDLHGHNIYPNNAGKQPRA
ncbi:MAG: hypothetical protein JW725_01545 [Candidatus Babeliaceae bacterium]|nr:hypothetical protein [Candidatus Babeliaceae bacterium]